MTPPAEPVRAADPIPRAEPSRPRGTARRELTLAVLACLAGAGLALFAATRTWAVEVGARPAPLPASRTPHTGGNLLPWLPALAVVALAGAGALLATRRAGRIAVGLLLAAAGLGVAAGAAYGLATVADVAPGWPALCVVGGLAVAAAGVAAMLRGRDWHSMGARYERPARGPASTRAATGTDMWEALDRGEDPTVDRGEDATVDRGEAATVDGGEDSTVERPTDPAQSHSQ